MLVSIVFVDDRMVTRGLPMVDLHVHLANIAVNLHISSRDDLEANLSISRPGALCHTQQN